MPLRPKQGALTAFIARRFEPRASINIDPFTPHRPLLAFHARISLTKFGQASMLTLFARTQHICSPASTSTLPSSMT